MTDQFDTLKGYIRQLAYREVSEEQFANGGGWTLASGARSRFYFNLKPVMFFPMGALALARRLVDIAPTQDLPYAVGGPEVGAIPLVCAIVGKYATTGFYVRKQAKGHGVRSLIEGFEPELDLKDRGVWLVEDVTTSGASLARCVATCREVGLHVLGSTSVVDRESGATELLEDLGVPHRSVFRASEFAS